MNASIRRTLMGSSHRQLVRAMTALELLAAAVVLVVFAAILFPMFTSSRGHPRKDVCLSEVKMLALAFTMYDDDAGHFPASSKWMDRLDPYVNNYAAFHCPLISTPSSEKYGYAMKTSLSQVSLKSLNDPSGEALVFDSNLLSRNATTNTVTVPNFTRHPRQNIGYADGHARPSKIVSLQSH